VSELRVDAVLFDLDGVLVDSDAIYERHWRRWAAERDVDPEAVLAVHHGRRAVEVIERLTSGLDVTAEAARYNAGLEADRDFEGLALIDGAIEMVMALPPDRWAIATSGPRAVAEPRMAHLGLPIPRVLVTADDVARGKPAPDPYLAAAAGLGFDPACCLVVEDAPAGIASARAAGCRVIGVASTHRADALGGADAVVARLSDLRIEPAGEGLIVAWAPETPETPETLEAIEAIEPSSTLRG
jgi:mannitol-1-/sugar-/sorbitol-6-phosphatase